MKLLILIPAFNEEGAVGNVVKEVRDVMPGVPVLVLGDPPGLNSPLVLANVPNGRFPVVATVWEHPRNGSKTIAAVAMAFGRQSPSTNSETCEVTIDGATAMIADPRRWERFPDSAQKLIQKEIWREIKDATMAQTRPQVPVIITSQ